MAIKHPNLPALAAITAARYFITTPECAMTLNKADQTLRKLYCLTGEAFGIRPIKCGNRLLWPVAQIADLQTGGF